MNSATSFTKYCTVDTNHVAIVKQLAYDSHRLAQPQMAAIENLDHDWSRIVDKNGKQLATVRHHFQLSQAFNKSGLELMGREGTCIACHRPDSEIRRPAQFAAAQITLLAAWKQMIVPATSILGVIFWLVAKTACLCNGFFKNR